MPSNQRPLRLLLSFKPLFMPFYNKKRRELPSRVNISSFPGDLHARYKRLESNCYEFNHIGRSGEFPSFGLWWVGRSREGHRVAKREPRGSVTLRRMKICRWMKTEGKAGLCYFVYTDTTSRLHIHIFINIYPKSFATFPEPPRACQMPCCPIDATDFFENSLG